MLSLPTLLLLALTLLHATSFHLSTTTRSISPLRISSDVETSTRVETTKESKNERLNRANKGLETHVVGLSIHHASLDIREKLAVPESHWNEVSRALVDSGACSEAAIISTCNRFEVYFSSPNSRESMSKVCKFLSARSSLPIPELRKNLFMLSGSDAVWHLFRVAGGLDSLIVGEGQILSQVRQCYMHASESSSDDVPVGGSGGRVISRMLNNALAAGKRVRSETAISKGSVSISSAAAELSELRSQQDLNLPFSEARLAVVGCGKMTRLLVTHLASRGLEKITIVNRSMARPQELAEQFPDVEFEIVLSPDLLDVVGRVDVVYTATSSPDVLLSKQIMEENGLTGRPVMVVDIAVPRNVDRDCTSVDGVTAYNVDDLSAVVAKYTAMRQKEIVAAEVLLREEADEFSSWKSSLLTVPTINQLQERAEEFRSMEVKKATRKLASLSDRELDAVERLSRGIVNKLLHGPMSHLKKSEDAAAKTKSLKEFKGMYGLDE